MKTIIAGSRTVTDERIVFTAIDASGFAGQISQVVSGGCRGPDMIGERWAMAKHIPIKRFPAEFDRYGPKAGPMRNRSMAEYVGAHGALIIVWDGKSRGSASMIDYARAFGLRIYIHSTVPVA